MKRVFLYLLAITLLSQAISAAVLVGKTEGAFSVSPTGAATYTIPIKFQSGMSDFIPNISLTYNSQSGNGIAGMGFGISGLSAISIVPRSIYFDNHAEAMKQSEDNAFTLDGMRLLLKSGNNGQKDAEYRTEHEQYNIISITNSQNGTPATFQVKATDGTTYKYGSSTGRYMLSNGKAYQWALDYAEDALGNYIQYNYSQEGVLYPTSITYGRNIHGSAGVDCTVLFNYESRPDSIPVYMFGEQHYLKKRLKSIVCKYRGNIYRTYTLNYTIDVFSHLTSVTETGRSSASVPPTTFEWEVPSEIQLSCSSRSMSMYTLEDPKKETFFSGDIDGDGISEIISWEYKSDNPLLPEGTAPYRTYFEGRKWNPMTQSFSFCFSSSTWAGTSISEMYSTIKSGGFLMHVSHGKGNSLVFPYVSRNEYDGSKTLIFKFVRRDSDYSVNLQGHSSDEDDFPLYILFDTDKDGLDNIFVIEKEKKNGVYPAYLVSLNLSTNYHQQIELNLDLAGVPDKIRCADFNLDGMTDLLITTSTGYYIYWNKNGSFSDSDRYYNTAFNKCDIIETGDFNGDGLVDLIINRSNSTDWYIAKNTGNMNGSFFALNGIDYLSLVGARKIEDEDREEAEEEGNSKEKRFYCIVQDMDGDGKSDAIVSYPHSEADVVNICVLKSNGYTLEYHSPILLGDNSCSGSPDICHIVQGNFDEHAGPEIMYWGRDFEQNIQGWHMLKNPTIKPSSQKIVAITDGLGATDSIGYGVLTDEEVYSITNSHNFPLIPMAGAMPVVKNRTESIPTDSKSTNYSYANGFVHMEGKGFLGFEDIRAESSLGIVTDTHCELDTTFYVLVSNTCTERDIHGEEISQRGRSMYIQEADPSRTNTRLYKTTGKNSNKRDSFNHYHNSEDSNNYENGFPLYQSSGDSFTGAEETITYWESQIDSIWIRGLPEEIETRRFAISSGVEGDDVYETRTYERDNATGLVLKEIQRRNGLLVSTDGYSYNEYGQMTRHYTVAFNSTDTLETRYEYNDKGQLFKEYDPKGLYRKYTYNPLSGSLMSVRGFDGVTTQYTYDGMLRETSRKRATIETYQTIRAHSNYGGGVYSIKETVTGKTPVTTYYDAWERKIAESHPLADGTVMYTDYHYLSNGKVGFESFPHRENEPALEGTTYTYDDPAQRLTKTEDSNGKINTWTYSPYCIENYIDGVPTTTYYYTSDWVNKVVDANGGITEYLYNVDGNILSIAVVPDDEYYAYYEYDTYGRLVQTTDVNGVVKQYSYDVNGHPYRTTIAGSYVETNYDKYGILRSKSWADPGESPHTVTYTYDNKYRPILEHGEGYTYSYGYDSYGRIASKTHSFNSQSPDLYINYQYGSENRISMKTCSIDGYDDILPTVTEEFTYMNGYRITDVLNDTLVYELTGQDRWGNVTEHEDFLGSTEYSFDDYGNMLSLDRSDESCIYMGEAYTYNVHTGNMSSKNGIPLTYDNMNQLTGYGDKTYSYDAQGNITSQPWVGDFSYDGFRVENLTADSCYVPDDSLRISYYKAIERPKSIENEHYKADIYYDGNGDRIMMKVYRKEDGYYYISFTRYYLDASAEVTIDSLGHHTHLIYAGGDAYTAPAVMLTNVDVNDSEQYSSCIYQITRDNLGSAILYDNADADCYWNSYSPWGVRTYQTINDTLFYQPGQEPGYGPFFRTYTGHEDLWMFGLLNVNARLYSPYLGRFVSPDPLLNSEGGPLDYNPYIYARNNPYKYIDRNGEFWWLVAAAVFGGFGNVLANFDNIDNAGSFFSYFGVGAAAGALSACVGSAINVAMAGGSFGAGFLGNTHGVASTGFFSGFASGAASGFTSGFITAAGNSWLNGCSFGDGFLNGLKSGAMNGVIEGGLSGIGGGIDALGKHANFFTGGAKIDLNGACTYSDCWTSGFEMPEPIFGKYVGEYNGVRVFESKKLGNIYEGAAGLTIPPYGIMVGKGTFTKGFSKGKALLQHEFGHYLQYKKIGHKAYYEVIAPESLWSATFHTSSHRNYWTETWANHLSKIYFGNDWIGHYYNYPAIKISNRNWDKVLKSMIHD